MSAGIPVGDVPEPPADGESAPSKRNPGKKLTLADWNRLAESLRNHPTDFTLAARKAGITVGTAHRAYTIGVAYLHKPPLREHLAKEQEAARARLAKKSDDALAQQEEARKDAVETVLWEGKLVRQARASAVRVAAYGGELLAAAEPLAKQIAAWIQQNRDVTNAEGASAGLRVLERLANFSQRGAELTRAFMEMERLRLGEPTNIIGLEAIGNMTTDQAMHEIDAAARAAARARASGVVIDVEATPVAGDPAAAWDGEMPEIGPVEGAAPAEGTAMVDVDVAPPEPETTADDLAAEMPDDEISDYVPGLDPPPMRKVAGG